MTLLLDLKREKNENVVYVGFVFRFERKKKFNCQLAILGEHDGEQNE